MITGTDAPLCRVIDGGGGRSKEGSLLTLMRGEAAFGRSAMLTASAMERHFWLFGSDWSSSLHLGWPGDEQLG